MSRPLNLSHGGTGGFTLVEALAALTVMTISMSAIATLSYSSIRSSLYVERHLAEIETARKIIAGIPSRNELGDGPLTGTLDNHRWRIDSAPYPNSLIPPNSPIAWQPERVALRISSPDGGAIEIDTVRLRKRATR